MAAGMKRISFRTEDLTGAAAGLAPNLAAREGETVEDRASRYLRTLFGAPDVPTMSLSTSDPTAAPALKPGQTIEQPLTDTTQVSFDQTFNGVAVHGAGVGVEMASSDGALLRVDGQVAEIDDLDPLPHFPPARAVELARALATADQAANMPVAPAEIVVRFDEMTNRWRLAYVFRGLELIPLPPPPGAQPVQTDDGPEPVLEQRYDLFLDAHDGQEIVRVPLIHHAGQDGRGQDGSGRNHSFVVEPDGARFVLRDSTRPISTHTLGFGSWRNLSALPGPLVASDTTTFTGPGVSAHAHALAVLDYLKRVFKRNGIDGRGGSTISCVDCLDKLVPTKVWRNAAWIRADSSQYPDVVRKGLMIYGQINHANTPPAQLSIAEGLDIVAHELTHGVTDYSGGLEYVTESGALNESYSDIFGIVIANGDRPLDQWSWDIGAVLNDGARPLRSLEDPARYKQPDHYADRRQLKPGELPADWNDHGYVHDNSGIHNKAAYILFKSKAMTPAEVAQLFYLTLTTPGRLQRTASFADSREGLVASADTLFRTRTAADRKAKIAAIRDAFSKVGL